MDLTKHWAATLDDYVIDLSWSPPSPPSGGQASPLTPPTSNLTPHASPILAAASAAGPISLFSAADGATQHLLPGHDDGTNVLAFGTTGLASAGQDGSVKLWDPAAGQHLATANLGSNWVEHLAWSPGTTAIKAGDATPALSPSNGPSSRSNTPPTSNLTPPASPILAAAAGRQLTLLRPDGSVLHAFDPAPKTITALAWKPAPPPSGGQASPLQPSTSYLPPPTSPILSVAYFGGVCLWNAQDFSAIKEFAYANGIHALAWSPDGKWLVSGNQDPSVHLWVPDASDELHMSGYETKVKHLAFDRTSRWLATGGGRDVCVWDCSGPGPEGREPAMLPHDAPICALAFQHAHGLLASASQDGVVRLWSLDRDQPLRATVKMPAAASKLLWSPDDSLLAIGSEKGAVYVLKAG